MLGNVLTFDRQTSSGIISADDGARYSFTGADVQENFERIGPGAQVDFTADGESAKAIYVVKPAGGSLSSGPKEKIIAAVLAFFLGGLGVHKFYLGKNTAGVIMLATSLLGIILLFIPTLIISLIAFIEAIIYLVKDEQKFQEEYVEGDKAWF